MIIRYNSLSIPSVHFKLINSQRDEPLARTAFLINTESDGWQNHQRVCCLLSVFKLIIAKYYLLLMKHFTCATICYLKLDI